MKLALVIAAVVACAMGRPQMKEMNEMDMEEPKMGKMEVDKMEMEMLSRNKRSPRRRQKYDSPKSESSSSSSSESEERPRKGGHKQGRYLVETGTGPYAPVAYGYPGYVATAPVYYGRK